MSAERDDQRQPHDEPQREEPPPILRRWGVLYALVIGALALQVLLYYLLASAYR